MRALITGGAGFIGSHLSEGLLNRDYQVSVIDNMSTGNLDNVKSLIPNPRFELINASIPVSYTHLTLPTIYSV